MALTSTSTLNEAMDQYLTNNNWFGDTTKAAACREAIIYLLNWRPASGDGGGSRVEYSTAQLESELKEINKFLSVTCSTADVAFAAKPMFY